MVRLSAVMLEITDLSLREVGDITFAFYNSKGWGEQSGGDGGI